MPNTPSRSPLGGGCLLSLCLIGGVILGVQKGQPSLGLLAGLGVGTFLAVLVWAWDRSRNR
jgi:hypothetical protein